jgi:hypothetical protein
VALLEPHNLPFLLAFGLLALTALGQVLGLSDALDSAGEFEATDGLAAGGFGEGLASLLGLGRVPLMIWLTMLLFVFGTLGVAGQAVLDMVFGAPLPAGIAALVDALRGRRASKETAFVRTGVGSGEKVVMNGGALVFPVFHETMPVNMNTLVLPVVRRDSEALITLDRLRIDVKAEFYVRVRPDASAIAMAAQTLGQRTMQPELRSRTSSKASSSMRCVRSRRA